MSVPKRSLKNMTKTRWSSRPIEASDQSILWEMLYIALWDAPDDERRPRSVLKNPAIQRLVANWGRPEDFGLVAFEVNTNEQVGAIWARLDGFDQIEDYGCSYPLIGIAVTESFQRKGVGTFLLKSFIDSVSNRVAGLRLGVNPKNRNAIGLYQKFGFVEYGVGAGGYPQMKIEFPKSEQGSAHQSTTAL